MEAAAISATEEHDRLSIRAVLGLGDSTSASWTELRGLQYANLRQYTMLRIVGHCVATLLFAFLCFGFVGPQVFAVWALTLSGAVLSLTRIERGLRNTDRRRMTKTELWQHTAWSALIGLIWSSQLIFFGVFADPEAFLVLSCIVMILAMGSALSISAPPLVTITFALPVSCGMLIGLVVQDNLIFAAVPTTFAVIVVIGTLEKSRTFLSALIAEKGIAEKEQVVSLLLREFEENGADWLWQIDPGRKLRNVSPRFAFALGTSPEQAVGQPFVQLIAGAAWNGGILSPSLHDLAERLNRRESFSSLLVQVEIGAEKRWWELSGTAMLDAENQYIGFRGVGSDVTEQRESTEKIAYLARYDTLTALPNRLLLHEQLNEALRYSAQWRTSCAFLMLDLDRFKAVNDTLGHLVGDKLLAQVADRLKSLMGNTQVCGRLGGDEFAIVVRDLSDPDDLHRLATLIIEHLTKPYHIDGHALYVGTSVGSAIGPRDGQSVEELMRNADLALYEAKGNGGGEHCRFETKLHISAEEKRKLEASLRNALQRDEFHLQFQPVVDANTEQLVSCEALLRWTNPEHGAVSPVKFIPMAEDTRMIVPLGRWVLEQSCRKAMAWPESVMVNVNVSPPQLLEPDFAQMVQSVLRDTGLHPKRLEIEVTESVFLSDPKIAREALEKVIELGCSVALDDFGTGYSSLGYLKTLRFSTIKVDRLFVQGAAQGNRESLAIIRAVVAMSDSLGMSTTAEGVENMEEAALIRSLGCTKIQGYYFGRPMDADMIDRTIAKGPREIRERA